MISLKSNLMKKMLKKGSGRKWVIILCDEFQKFANHDYLILDILK